MKTKKPRTAGTQPAKAKKSNPLTITFTGDLADELRAIAKQFSQRPSTAASIHLRLGLLRTGNSEEAEQYRLESAANYVGLSLSATQDLHARALRAEAEYVSRLRQRSADAPADTSADQEADDAGVKADEWLEGEMRRVVSDQTGLPAADARRLCMRAGLALFEREGVTIGPLKPMPSGVNPSDPSR